jgi:hypothetical protein
VCERGGVTPASHVCVRVQYVNGVEVGRVNMPTGLVSSTTPAGSRVDIPVWSTGANYTIEFPSSLVVARGRTKIAVELHQDSLASTDAAFDAELVYVIQLPSVTPSVSPTVSLTSIPKGPETIAFFDKWKYRDDGVDLGIDWSSELYNDLTWKEGRMLAGEDAAAAAAAATMRTRLTVRRFVCVACRRLR